MCASRANGLSSYPTIDTDPGTSTEFLTALADVDPDLTVNIEHEDVDYSRVDGLRLAADNLLAAAKAAGV